MAKRKKLKIYDGLIPFKPDGSLVEVASLDRDEIQWYDYDTSSWQSAPIDWRKNFIFDDGLAVISCESTGWSNYFELYSVNDGKRYITPVKNMPHIFSLASIYQQEVDGVWRLVLACHWTFNKNGDKYFVTAVDPEQI